MCQCCVPPDKNSAVGPSREKTRGSPCSLHHNCFIFFFLAVGNKLLCAKFSSNTFMQREVPAAQKSLSLPSPGAAQASASSTGFAAQSILLMGGFPSLGRGWEERISLSQGDSGPAAFSERQMLYWSASPQLPSPPLWHSQQTDKLHHLHLTAAGSRQAGREICPKAGGETKQVPGESPAKQSVLPLSRKASNIF